MVHAAGNSGRGPLDAVEAFRAQFPVLDRVAYLNAGTDGPLPRRAAEAAADRMSVELERGRSGDEHSRSAEALAKRLRDEAAALLGATAAEVALTHSTTDGINTVVSALGLASGDEVLTSDEEHPGLLAPLAAARRRDGIAVRVAPFESLADSVGPRTRLVAASHVGWVSGRVLDTDALAATNLPLLLDGAQGLGAVPVEVKRLGCDFYAASGQKWLCGPDGTGYLYVCAKRIGDLSAPWPSYGSLADPRRALEPALHADARRFDMGVVAGPAAASALAALELLREAGWPWIHERARGLAAGLADLLAEQGLDVAPRGPSTLVSWRSEDPDGDVRRLADEHVVVRAIPGAGLVRASVGAWSHQDELERLAALAR